MLKYFILIFFIQNSIYAQHSERIGVEVSGYISENKDKDTLFLSNLFINSKFFEDSLAISRISSGEFSVDFDITYPHLYKLNYASEKGKIIARPGAFFIDESTNYIKIDSSNCIQIKGKAFEEFTNKFIPFFNDKNDSCSLATIESLKWNNPFFDAKLKQYTINHPDSYVALWALITSVNEEGHSNLYDSIAHSFSDKVKNEKLWKTFYEDFQNIRIKENHKFPEMLLKNKDLKHEKLRIPKAKVILVDYWFSNCKPCLEAFPKLKVLYDKYNSKGFEIVSISIDRAKDIEKWKNRIREFNLKWDHYLDENGIEAEKDKIRKFPTTFLLDTKGEIIKKNITIEELEEFLKENL